jgi:predicted DNA-binding WGR domain protein
MKDGNFKYTSWQNAQRAAQLGAEWAIYLECHNPRKNQHKFYEVLGSGIQITRVRNGRVGTWGRVQKRRDWSYVLEKVPEKLFSGGYDEHISDNTKTSAPFPYSEIRHLVQEGHGWVAQNDQQKKLMDLPTQTVLDLLNKNSHTSRRRQDHTRWFEIQPPILL